MNISTKLAISKPRRFNQSVFCASLPEVSTVISVSENGVEPLYPRRVMATNRTPFALATADTFWNMANEEVSIFDKHKAGRRTTSKHNTMHGENGGVFASRGRWAAVDVGKRSVVAVDDDSGGHGSEEADVDNQ
jgi:hypothetical protein